MKTLFFSFCYCLFFISSIAQPRMVTIDSVSLYVHTLGVEQRAEGQPVIVFESGLGTPMDNWDRVIDEVATFAPVVTYERPGVGQSPAIDELPTVPHVADRVVALLAELDLPPPYVLVGHSLGGMYVRGFANRYPELLAGLVIIDPADFTETKANIRDHYEVLDWEQARIDSLIQSFIDKRKESRQSAPLPIKREREVLEKTRANDFEEITSTPLPNIPVHILASGRFDKPEALRSTVYDEQALFWSKTQHRIRRWTDVIQTVDRGKLLYSSHAGHFIQWDDPLLVISSIRMVIDDYHKTK